tara:strand:+ start:274 stop:459 length:186 start_codon:yes stop_codon:yes gene_type:complete
MLRNAVKTIDTVRPARSFGDRDEWVKVLLTEVTHIELSEATGPPRLHPASVNAYLYGSWYG